ncbi:hypothetical protein EFO91_10335 [Lactiplantibacillus plantarum]|uniref:hypothetical protein n=1 Tax=Lactiplantibacillus plantarum TaxID=1590 RepID=UPI001591ABF8|nr:hypothetical protein [Lactiplantibacillus plantarum]MCT3226041.1 hypothetical protein [Lactiplantibacillus plantarum]MCT3272365.1 hypothetical protein [Lactiplantibacillus plantarum]WIR72314.1 hypothetical protein QP382_14320 [Lactiplantibacillus plantarum]
MKFNLSYGITAIIAFVALLSPIITALINDHHLSIMKKIEYSQENLRNLNLHKRQLFENYLTAVGNISIAMIDGNKITDFDDIESRLNDFIRAYYLILPYIPKKELNYFSTYSNETFKMDFSSQSSDKLAKLLGSHILPTIRSEIDKL